MPEEENDIIEQAKRMYQEISETSIFMYAGLVSGLVFAIAFIISTLNGTGWSIVAFFIQLWGLRLLITPITRLRRLKYDNFFTYRQAFTRLIRVIMYAALIATFLKYIYLQFLNPTYLGTQITAVLELFEKAGRDMTQDEITLLEQMIVPIRFVMYNMMLDILGGLFLALIAAIFMRGHKTI